MDSSTQAHIQALGSTQLERIEDAIIGLGESRDPKAIAPLVRSFHRHADQPDLKALICDALGELGDLRAVSALLSHLRDPDPIVRESASDALLMIGNQCAHAMPDASDWESDFAAPSVALTQIAWQTDMEAVRLLLDVLQGPQHAESEVRVSALYTLGLLKFIGAFDHIKAALFDHDAEVSAAAAFAFSELARSAPTQLALSIPEILYQAWNRERAGHPSLSAEARVQVLRAAAECPISDIESSSPESVRARQYVEALLSAALSYPDVVVRQLAVIGLGRLGDPRASPLLLERLHDEAIAVRRHAAYALGALALDSSASALISACVKQPSEVRVALAWALKRLDRSVALRALAESSVAPEATTRVACAYLSGALSEPNTLQSLLSDSDLEVRKSAALAVGSMRAHGLSNALMQLLNDPEWRVRTGAAEGLKRLGDTSARDALEGQLAQETHAVARNAIQSSLRALLTQA